MTQAQPKPGYPRNNTRRIWQFLNANLVVALVVLILTGAGGYFYGNRRVEFRKAQLDVAREMEPWINVHMGAIRDSANISRTYGSAQDVADAAGLVARLNKDNAAYLNTRGAELARTFGADALAAYAGINAATQRLQHCLEITSFRMTAYPNEPQNAAERKQLRTECSEYLQELNDRANALILLIARGLPNIADEKTALKPNMFQWVRADIKVNGHDGPVDLQPHEEFTYTWNAPDATACQLTSPSGISGISLRGMDGPIGVAHPWYPQNRTTMLVLQCTNGWHVAADSVAVSL